MPASYELEGDAFPPNVSNLSIGYHAPTWIPARWYVATQLIWLLRFVPAGWQGGCHRERHGAAPRASFPPVWRVLSVALRRAIRALRMSVCVLDVSHYTLPPALVSLCAAVFCRVPRGTAATSPVVQSRQQDLDFRPPRGRVAGSTCVRVRTAAGLQRG
mgnify:CR=1 FL=1